MKLDETVDPLQARCLTWSGDAMREQRVEGTAGPLRASPLALVTRPHDLHCAQKGREALCYPGRVRIRLSCLNSSRAFLIA
jgi:hypothetical protein